MCPSRSILPPLLSFGAYIPYDESSGRQILHRFKTYPIHRKVKTYSFSSRARDTRCLHGWAAPLLAPHSQTITRSVMLPARLHVPRAPTAPSLDPPPPRFLSSVRPNGQQAWSRFQSGRLHVCRRQPFFIGSSIPQVGTGASTVRDYLSMRILISPLETDRVSLSAPGCRGKCLRVFFTSACSGRITVKSTPSGKPKPSFPRSEVVVPEQRVLAVALQ